MNTRILFVLAGLGLVLASGCKPKEPTSLQRKEAATLASEAQFALQLKDLPRAEGLLAKASDLCPDTGKYGVDLGSIRVRLGKKDAARAAYQRALKAYEDDAARPETKDAGPMLQQIYVLGLLGRVDDARAVLLKAQKKYPESRSVRSFIEGKQIDKMIADPSFKLIAL
jgi:tetratricopeptide (TPR) repeat protein